MHIKNKPLNRQCRKIRAAWCYWVIGACKTGRMSNKLAERVTAVTRQKENHDIVLRHLADVPLPYDSRLTSLTDECLEIQRCARCGFLTFTLGCGPLCGPHNNLRLGASISALRLP